MKVRAAKPTDAKAYSEWLTQNAGIGLPDYDVITYPTANTAAVVGKDGEPVLFNTVHLVLMQESLAPQPGLGRLDGARAINALHETLKKLAAASGVREIWMECTDPRIEKIATKRGWKRVNRPVLKYKLGR